MTSDCGGRRGPSLVARLSGTNGSFDPTFGDGGKVFADIGQGPFPASQLNALTLQPDGNILLGGYATDHNGNNEFLVARLDGASGNFDPSFGSGGTVLRQFGALPR